MWLEKNYIGSKTIGDCEIPTKVRIRYRKHCLGPDDHRGRPSRYHCQTEFEYQYKIKHKTRVIQNMCRGAFVNGWIPNLANL